MQRTVTNTRQEVLIRYGVGVGARPIPLVEGGESPKGIVETWVPIDETFLKKGYRYYRVIVGHGDWVDIPIEE